MSIRILKLSIAIFLAVLILLNIIPLTLLILLSLGRSWSWPQLFPSFSAAAWHYVLNPASGSLEAFLLSFKIALAATFINLLLALPAAKSLAHYKFKGQKTLEMLLLLPALFPPWVVISGIHRTFIKIGLTDTISGVVLAHIIPTLPYVIRTLTTSFTSIGYDLEEQAWLLGASRLKTFFIITLPLLLPGIAAASILSVLISLSEYLTTLIIGGGNILTLTLIMFPFVNGGNPTIGAAYAVLFALMAAATMATMDTFINRYYSENKLY